MSRGRSEDRVLVTGATGFIGRKVAPLLLARGFHVHALSRHPPEDAGGLRWHTEDLADHRSVDRLIALVRPSHLLHLAWTTEHRGYYTTPDNVRFLRDSLHLVDAFVRAGGQRIVGAGSSAEYDFSSPGDFVEDATPLRPNGLYGVCKKALFEVLAQYAAQSDVQAAWGRIFFCYGPGEHQSRAVPTLVRDLLAGERVPFQAGTSLRDYVFIDDVAEAFAALVDSGASGPYNVGSGKAVTLRAFATEVATACGVPDAIDFGALPTPDYEPPRVVADVTRITRDLAWRPTHSTRQGAGETVAWWRAAGPRSPRS